MKSLSPVMRSLVAGFAIAGSALVSGHALANTGGSAPAPSKAPGTSITKPLTTPFSVVSGHDTDLTNVRGTFNPTWLGGASAYSSLFDLSEMRLGGTLILTAPASQVTFTLVGFESTLNNTFSAGGRDLSNSAGLGNSISFSNVGTGELDFGFRAEGSSLYKLNGSSSTGVILARDNSSALILFNERFGDRDFDDMVVRVSISAVPEPETYAMLLAGLGLLGVVARRRQNRG